MRQNHGTVIILKMGRNLKPPEAPGPCVDNTAKVQGLKCFVYGLQPVRTRARPDQGQHGQITYNLVKEIQASSKYCTES